MNKINEVYFFYRTIFGDSRTEFYNEKWLKDNPNLKFWIDKRKILQKELDLINSEKDLVFFENNWQSIIGYPTKEDFLIDFNSLRDSEKIVFSEALMDKNFLFDLTKEKNFSFSIDLSHLKSLKYKFGWESGFEDKHTVITRSVEEVIDKNNVNYLIWPWWFGNNVRLQKEISGHLSEIAKLLDKKFEAEGTLGLNNSLGIKLDFSSDKRIQGLHFKLNNNNNNKLSSCLKIDISNKNWKRIFCHEWCHALEWVSNSSIACRKALEKIKDSLSFSRPIEPNLDCILLLKRWSRVWKEKSHFFDELTDNLNNEKKFFYIFDDFLKSLKTEEEKDCFNKIKKELLFFKDKGKKWKDYLEEIDEVSPNKTGVAEYWSSKSEMLARAFETWIHADALVSEDFKISDIEMCFKNYPCYTSWVYIHKELKETTKALKSLFKASTTVDFHVDSVFQPNVPSHSKKF